MSPPPSRGPASLPSPPSRSPLRLLSAHVEARSGSSPLPLLPTSADLKTYASRGIEVWTYDAYGHGKSSGGRADFRVPRLVDDLCVAIAEAVKEAPGGKVFVGGISLGGLVSTMAAQRDQSSIAGLVLLAPALGVTLTPVMRLQNAIAPVLFLLVPKARIVPAVRPEDLNADPVEVTKYLNDPLNTTGNVRVGSAFSTKEGMALCQKLWPSLTAPILAFHGDVDKCTEPAFTKAFVQAARSDDKRFVSVEGGYHEFLHSPDGPGIKAQIGDWILARTAEKTAKAPDADGQAAQGAAHATVETVTPAPDGTAKI